MEGPTPVSALIHAATMVTAGVYLIARFAPLWNASPAAQELVGIVGALTMVLGAILGVGQWDIKRILAYSTMSQIGYMIMGVGVGAYQAGVLHFFTHAFFKAQLFLGAGLIIHALHDEQDVRKMGGLLPPHAVRVLGDAAGHARDHRVSAVLGLLFEGRRHLRHARTRPSGALRARRADGRHHRVLHVPDDFRRVLRPVPRRGAGRDAGDRARGRRRGRRAARRVARARAGLADAGPRRHPDGADRHRGLPLDRRRPRAPGTATSRTLFGPGENAAVPALPITEILSTGIVLVVVSLGIVLAYLRYGAPAVQGDAVDRLRREAVGMPQALRHAFWFDDAIGLAIVRPSQALGTAISRFVDPHVIDAGVRDLAWLAGALGLVFRALQNGLVRAYALTIVIGAACFIAYFAYLGVPR